MSTIQKKINSCNFFLDSLKSGPKRKDINKGVHVSEKVLSQEEQEKLNNLKGAHDIYATAIMHYTSGRFQFAHEEFDGISLLVNFFRMQREALLADIHKIEPPAPKEAPAAHVMDLTHVKPAPVDGLTESH